MTQAANDNSTRIITVADISVKTDGEERVSHKRIAAALGMAQHHKLRHLIERNIVEFQRYGEVPSTVDETSSKGGRPGQLVWLNEGQAILAAVRSDAPRAPDVRYEVITAFMEYRRSQGMVKVQAHERRTSTRIDDAIRLRTNIDRLERATADIAAIAATRYLTAMVVNGEPVVVDVNDYMMEGDDEAVILKWDGSLEITKPVNVVLRDNRFHNDDVSVEEGRKSYSRFQQHGDRSGFTPFRKQGSMTVRDGCVILGKVIRSARPPRPSGEMRLLDTPAGRDAARLAAPAKQLSAPALPHVARHKRDVAIRKMAIAGMGNKEIAEVAGVSYWIAARVAGETRKVRARSLGRVA